MGGSYGGFMTSWLCSHTPGRFAAGISERAVNAWDSFAGSSDIGYYFADAYVGDDRDTQWRASPLAYADDIAVPLLIIHSEHDWRCPVEQGQRLFVALKRRGAPVEMLLFPGRGTRTVPVRPAPAPGATVRGHPGLVGALLAGVTGPAIGRIRSRNHPGRVPESSRSSQSSRVAVNCDR